MVFKEKRRVDRSIDKFKACLALVTHLDLELFQMDIKTIFLNGNLEKEIYIDQPIGFASKRSKGQNL